MSRDLPEGWEEKTLGNVCNIGGGVGFKEIMQGRRDLPFPFIKVSDMNDFGNEIEIQSARNYVDTAMLKAMGAKLFLPGSVVLPKVGAAALTNKRRLLITPTAVDNNIMVWTPVGIDSSFLFHWSKSIDLASFIQTGALPSFNKSLAESVSILLPPLHEQRKIAEILSSVDNAIAATQAVIEQTKKVKQSTLEHLLAKGIGHTRFKQTEIGEIPEAWELSTLVDAGVGILDGDRGKEYPKAEDYLDNGYCLFLNAKNVTRAGFVFEELQFISKEKHKKLRNGLLNPLDIVVTTRGTIGNFAFFDTEVPFNCMRINSGMAIMRSASSKLLPNFLFALLGSALIERQLARRVFGSAQPQLTLEILRKLIVPLPSEEEQFILSTKAREFGELEKRQLIELASLNNLKLSLMSDLLTGRKRVTDTLPLAAE